VCEFQLIIYIYIINKNQGTRGKRNETKYEIFISSINYELEVPFRKMLLSIINVKVLNPIEKSLFNILFLKISFYLIY